MLKKLLRSIVLLSFSGGTVFGAVLSPKPIPIEALGRSMLVRALSPTDNYTWYGENDSVRDVSLKTTCSLHPSETEFVVLVDPQTGSDYEVRGHLFIYLKYRRVDGISLHECDKKVFAVKKRTLQNVLEKNEESLQIRQVAVLGTQ